MSDTLIINKRFNGPPTSGNGGYTCGMLAAYIDGIAEVTLRLPPPLDVAMDIEMKAPAVVLRADGHRAAVAEKVELDLQPPMKAPALAAAQEASKSYYGFESHAFATCFVCGPDREEGDGLRIFPGDSEDGSYVLAPWIPANNLADSEGLVKPQFIWAALDCPGASALGVSADKVMVLGRFACRIDAAVYAGKSYIVTGWAIGSEGRKHFAGTAIFSEDGQLCGVGRATWIQINPPS